MKTIESGLIADIAVISLRGRDAASFAQSQFMNDVAALPDGHWHWNGWLSPKGRVQALFALAKPAPDELLLVLLDAPGDAFRDALAPFVLRSKVTLEHRTDLAAFAIPAPHGACDDHRNRLRRADDGAVDMDASGDGVSRWLRIATRAEAAAEPDASRAWREADLRHGLPRWRAGREHGWTPHMLSLDRLKAFSTRKGCYPGQEIVARTHFLGQAKRQAWWLEGHGLETGSAVEDASGRPVGEILEATTDGRGALAVAALPGPAAVTVGGQPARATPPLGGLARPA